MSLHGYAFSVAAAVAVADDGLGMRGTREVDFYRWCFVSIAAITIKEHYGRGKGARSGEPS